MKGNYCIANFFAFMAVLFIPLAVAAPPAASLESHNKTIQSELLPSTESAAEHTYVIRRGDNLYRIAKTFGTTLDALMATNQIQSAKIKVGQVITVPAPKDVRAQSKSLDHENSPDASHKLPASTNTQMLEGHKRDLPDAAQQNAGSSLKASSSKSYQKYVIRRGDTLSQIAKTFRTTPETLKSANKLKSSRIKVGQTLRVPAIESTASKDKSPDTNKVPDSRATPTLVANVPRQTITDPDTADNVPLRERLVEAGFQMLGVRYRYSGTSEKTGLDCSALVKNIFSKLNIALPRSSREQFKTGEKIDRDNLEAGDLVFFSSGGKTPNHVGIYIGNNQFIHAARKARKVIVSDLNKLWYKTRYLGARRIMDLWWEEPESPSESEN